ncbi:MAG: magnesium transporter [Shewanella sp.]
MIENQQYQDNTEPFSGDFSDWIQTLTLLDGDAQAQCFAEMLDEAEPGFIALALESLPREQRLDRWQQIDGLARVAVLTMMRSDPRQSILNLLDDDEVDLLFAMLSPEELIDWSDTLPEALVDRALQQMGNRQRERYEIYDQFNESQVGRYADHRMLVLSDSANVAQAQRFFRRIALDCGDNVFITDIDDKYIGTVSRQMIFKADGDVALVSLIDEDKPVLAADTGLFDAAEYLQHSNETEMPILAEDGQLLGRLSLRVATEIIREHLESQLMAGAGLKEDNDLFAPVLKSAQRRAVWLGINLLTAFLASATISLFEPVLAQVVALAVLMPVVASMGGIAGSQSLTLMIRGMAMGQVSRGNLWPLMRNEIGISIVNGVVWSIVIACVAAWWFADPSLGFIIGCAIMINLLAAAASGVLIPMILDKFNQDAALSGSVILTTVTDVIGFFSFLGLATWIYL